MPNRILRDWTDSKTIEALSWHEEVLFTRLIMKVDDFGKYHADPILLKSLLFPRRNGVRVNDITRWLQKLEITGLILCYTSQSGDAFLRIEKFNQRLRNMKSSFPDPERGNSGNDRQLTVIRRPESEGNGNEVETEKESEGESSARAQLVDFLLKLIHKSGKKYFRREATAYKAAFNDLTGKNIDDLNEFNRRDEQIYEKFFAGPVRREIEKMLNYYGKNNNKTNSGEPITDWSLTLFSWLDRKDDFGSRKTG